MSVNLFLASRPTGTLTSDKTTWPEEFGVEVDFALVDDKKNINNSPLEADEKPITVALIYDAPRQPPLTLSIGRFGLGTAALLIDTEKIRLGKAFTKDKRLTLAARRKADFVEVSLNGVLITAVPLKGPVNRISITFENASRAVGEIPPSLLPGPVLFGVRVRNLNTE